MEQWLKDAKELAHSEAEDFIKNMNDIASKYDLEPEWFIEEVVKNKQPRIVAMSCLGIYEELFANMRNVDAHVDGRITVVE